MITNELYHALLRDGWQPEGSRYTHPDVPYVLETRRNGLQLYKRLPTFLGSLDSPYHPLYQQVKSEIDEIHAANFAEGQSGS